MPPVVGVLLGQVAPPLLSRIGTLIAGIFAGSQVGSGEADLVTALTTLAIASVDFVTRRLSGSDRTGLKRHPFSLDKS